MFQNKKIGVVIKGVVQSKNGEFLLVKKGADDADSKLWDLPGGMIEFGQNPYAALYGHVKKTTGLEVDVLKPTNVWSHMKKDTHLIGITFLCTTDDDKMLSNSSEKKHSWADSKTILNSKIPKWLKDEIRVAQLGKEESMLDIELPEEKRSFDKLYKKFGL
ncbi:MAG: NUDIX domain-containing protein [Candidatus Woesearchaeota archaeon]